MFLCSSIVHSLRTNPATYKAYNRIQSWVGPAVPFVRPIVHNSYYYSFFYPGFFTELCATVRHYPATVVHTSPCKLCVVNASWAWFMKVLFSKMPSYCINWEFARYVTVYPVLDDLIGNFTELYLRRYKIVFIYMGERVDHVSSLCRTTDVSNVTNCSSLSKSHASWWEREKFMNYRTKKLILWCAKNNASFSSHVFL